jgi:hypothetical protein
MRWTSLVYHPFAVRSRVSMTHGQSFIVVAIAGLVRPIQVRTRKLLDHCGVTAIEIPCDADALESLRGKVRVDAVVLDARSLVPSEQPVAPFATIASSSGDVSGGFSPVSVIVLGNKHVPVWVRPMCERTGARFFATGENGPNYPALIRVLRETCGVETACCSPSTMPVWR